MKLRLFISILTMLPLLAHTQKYQVVRLGDHINTDLNEISPILSDDGQTLMFTRIGSPSFNATLVEDFKDLSQTLSKNKYEEYLCKIYSDISQKRVTDYVGSYYNQDVFIASRGNGQFMQVEHPPHPLNNALPNSVCSNTPDPNEFIVSNQFFEEGGMSPGFSTITRQKNGSFSFPKAIKIDDFYTYSEEVGFSMSPDGNTVIMSLHRDDTFGDLDLYVSFRVSSHSFTRPLNMGRTINTAHREIAPYVSRDNNRLFFSSNRGAGKDFDIYTAQRKAYSWQTWAELKKLPRPINSSFDDSHPFFVEQTDELFFISTRDGNSDIYQVNLTPIIKKDKNLSIKGKIIDAITKKTIRATLDYGPSDEKGQAFFFNSYSGYFNINLVFNSNFRFTAKKNGYISSEVELNPDQFAEFKSNYEMVLELSPINKIKFIEIGNLQFKQSEAILLPSANSELNRLYRILKADPSIHIRIEGHTDSVGDGTANVALSKARALAIKQYLADKGISGTRISTEGFGDTRPLNENLTEKDRQLNRRVEVRILRDSN